MARKTVGRHVWVWRGLGLAVVFAASAVTLVSGQRSEPSSVQAKEPRVDGRDSRPQGGVCPAGTHLVHRTGESGIVDPDTVRYRDRDYACRPDERPADAHCSENGTPVVRDGVAACACRAGYAGRECRICAPGFERGPHRMCVRADPRQPPPVIDGATHALEQGQALTLRARLSRGAAPDALSAGDFRWRIVEGGGCLTDGPRGRCGKSARGASVTFHAPTFGKAIEMTRVEVARVPMPGGGSLPPATTSITWVPPGDIPISGYGDSRLQPILSALAKYMRYRCIGAAMIGIARYGQPLGAWGLGRMNGRASLNADPACGGDVDDPYDPASANVQDDTPFRIGSISKSVTAATTRWALKEAWKILEPGADPSDDDLEALSLFADNDYPAPLFPQNLHDLFSGNATLPVVVSPELGDTADPRWTEVTVGNILAHRSGMPRSAPNFITIVTPNLPALRGWASESDVEAEEQILIDEVGAITVDLARSQLGLANTYLVPRPTLEEWLATLAGRVLSNDPGTYNYSNTGPAFLATMVEQFIASGRYAAGVGYPEQHQGSALQQFFEHVVGLQTTGNSGIFGGQTGIGTANHVDREPSKRFWSTDQLTYTPTGWDLKRPHCVWSDDGCDFSNWVDAASGRINWAWAVDRVPFWLEGAGLNPGSGSLVTEARTFLEFMSRFWVHGYGTNPAIGEARNNTWDVYTRHNGAFDGALAWAMQLGSDGPESWALPIDDDNELVDDFGNLSTYTCELQNGLPNGVDIIVAINTYDQDKKCVATKEYTCAEAYGLLDNFVLHGVCRVNWAVLTTTPNVTIPNTVP